MTMRRLTQGDVPEVTEFLGARAEYVMFPLNNLIRFGLDGSDPLAPRMWRNSLGPLSDILSVTKAGMVLPFLPSGQIKQAAQALEGRKLMGIIGPSGASRDLQSALGLTRIDMAMDADEGHFSLDLTDITVPDGASQIVPASEELRPTLTEWLTDYHINVLGTDAGAAADIVPDRISGELKEGRRVVLMQNDIHVATTAFNAVLPQIVQVGGVYTPPALRGQGLARRAVALHLQQAHADGVKHATLFASNPSAIAAYEAIGFRRIGDWVLTILKTPQVIP